MEEILLTSKPAKSVAEFIYSYVINYIKTNEKAFQNFISNIKNKERDDD